MAIKDEKIELLRKNDIFSQLREYELDIIARYSEFVRFGKGEPVFVHGSFAEELFIVDKGRIGIINVENKDDIMIAQIEPGESFGELDFFGRSTRNTAAFAELESILLRFPARGCKSDEIFMKHQYISAMMLYRLLGIISERIWNVNNILHQKSDWLRDLRKQLMFDKMTGLYNQSFLKEDFLNFLPDLGYSTALLMIKPDNFKEVNDKYGHEAGDQVLNIMAIFLQSELSESDIGIRYRGDEFAAILANTDKDGAISRAKVISKTYKSIDLSRTIGAHDIKIAISVGIALSPAESDNSRLLVEIAHAKMMRAREFGGNTIIV